MTKVMTHLNYEIVFKMNEGNRKEGIQHGKHSVDQRFYSSLFSSIEDDYNDELECEQNLVTPNLAYIPTNWFPGEGYLILSTSKYMEALSKLIEWKQELGFNVYFSLNDSWTPELIKNKISEVYQSSYILEYVLLFGDEEDLPGTLVLDDTHHYNPYYTDVLYGCMDGNDDLLPDLCIGRISVENLSQAQAVVEKIIKYENKEISVENMTGVHISEFEDCEQNTLHDYGPDGYEDGRSVRTSEDIVDGFLSMEDTSVKRIYVYDDDKMGGFSPMYWNDDAFGDGEPLPSYLTDPSFNWNGNKDDIINAINEGCLYTLYIGHGYDMSWINPLFSSPYIKNLDQTPVPLVFSMCCHTGKFQKYDKGAYAGRTECFSETFLRKDNGGCVGIIAASEKAFGGPMYLLTMEMFQSIWPKYEFAHSYGSIQRIPEISFPQQILEIGRILDAGKRHMYDYYHWTNSKMVDNVCHVFHCFGDPAMKLSVKPIKTCQYSITRVNNGIKYYNVRTSKDYDMVRVKKSGRYVEKATGGIYKIEFDERQAYDFYLVGEQILPTKIDFPEADFFSDPAQPYLGTLEQNGEILNINVSNPGILNVLSIRVMDLSTDEVLIMKYSDNSISVDLSNRKGNILLIALYDNNQEIESKKVLIK